MSERVEARPGWYIAVTGTGKVYYLAGLMVDASAGTFEPLAGSDDRVAPLPLSAAEQAAGFTLHETRVAAEAAAA